MRGLARCLDPLRRPSPFAAVACVRTGARRRASRQMNSEMPPSTMIAPIAMMNAELPLNPLPLPAVVVPVTVGAVVVVVGIDTLGCGKPDERGLLPGCAPSDCVGGGACVAVVDAASAADGRASAAPRSAARRSRTAFNDRSADSYASGCSIAGVSGAST